VSPVGKTIGDIFEAVAEDKLIQPTILYDFQRTFPRFPNRSQKDPALTETALRLSAAGMEIANGRFSELNDPAEQERRFAAQIARGGDEAPKQLDVDYLRALCHGMPPTAGEGIGIDGALTMPADGLAFHSRRYLVSIVAPRSET